jgi:hypothetical protein
VVSPIPFEHIPPLCVGSLVRTGGETLHASSCFPHSLCR